MRKALLLLVPLLAISAAADIRPPDLSTALENDYYTAGLERYDNQVLLYNITLHAAGLLGEDPVAGFIIPVVLRDVAAGTYFELSTPLGFTPDPEADYRLFIRYGVSGDEWVDDVPTYRLTLQPGRDAEWLDVAGHDFDTALEPPAHGDLLHLDVGGFYPEDESVEISAVFELYLVVALATEEPPGLEALFAALRDDPPAGTAARLVDYSDEP